MTNVAVYPFRDSNSSNSRKKNAVVTFTEINFNQSTFRGFRAEIIKALNVFIGASVLQKVWRVSEASEKALSGLGLQLFQVNTTGTSSVNDHPINLELPFDLPDKDWLKAKSYGKPHTQALTQFLIMSLISYMVDVKVTMSDGEKATTKQTCIASAKLVIARLLNPKEACLNDKKPQNIDSYYQKVEPIFNEMANGSAEIKYAKGALTISVAGVTKATIALSATCDEDMYVINANIVVAIMALARGDKRSDAMMASLPGTVNDFVKTRQGNTAHQEKIVNCKDKGKLRGGGDNSCYFNSTMVGLFHMHNEFLESQFLTNKWTREDGKFEQNHKEIQTELNHVKEIIQLGMDTNNSCGNLRQYFENFQLVKFVGETNSEDWVTQQKEPYDIIEHLTNLFDTPASSTWEQTMTFLGPDEADIGEPPEKSSLPDKFTIFVKADTGDQDLLLESELSTSAVDLQNPLFRGKFANIRTERRCIKAPFLHFHIARFSNDKKSTNSRGKVTAKIEKNYKRVVPPETMSIDKDKLTLVSVMQHIGVTISGGHYICFFLCDHNWYKYNDSRPDDTDMVDVLGEERGSYAALLKVGIPTVSKGIQDDSFVRNLTDCLYV